jgi:hypothetical protein
MTREQVAAELEAMGFACKTLAPDHGTSLWGIGDTCYVMHVSGPFGENLTVSMWSRESGPDCVSRYEGPIPETPAALHALLRPLGAPMPERRTIFDAPCAIPCRMHAVGEVCQACSVDRNWTDAEWRRLMGRRATDRR